MTTVNETTNKNNRIAKNTDELEQIYIKKIFNKLPKNFEAIILSGEPEQHNSAEELQSFGKEFEESNDNRFYFVRVMPIKIQGAILPNPFLAKTLDVAKRLINAYPLAYIEVNNSVHPPTHGDVYQCRLTTNDERGIALVKRLRNSGQKIGKISNREIHKAFRGSTSIGASGGSSGGGSATGGKLFTGGDQLTGPNNTVSKQDVIDVAWAIIAAKGSSKSYKSKYPGLGIDAVGKTYVGVLHFTGSALERLYKAMKKANVIGKYFSGKTYEDLINYSKPGSNWFAKEGQEQGHLGTKGVEKKGHWWLDGMVAFLDSSDSKPVQDAATISKFYNRVSKYKKKGFPFNNKRDLAVFMSLGNSSWAEVTNRLGKDEFKTNGQVDTHKMMQDYCSNSWRTRCTLTDKYYPGNRKLVKNS